MAHKNERKDFDPDREAAYYLGSQLHAAKKNNVPEILTVVLFALFIAVFAVSFWILPDRALSENENRELEQMPALTLESLTTSEEKYKFTTKFAKYMADQFPFRDLFVQAKAVCELLQNKGENNGVFLLEDALAERHDSIDKDKFDPNIEAIDAFIAACRKRGVSADFAVFGRAMDVRDLSFYGNEATDAAFALLDGHDHIDMRDALDGHWDLDLYYRTDHHHNSRGAYFAYKRLVELHPAEYGFEPEDISHYSVETVTEDFYGTAWSKSGAVWMTPDTIEYFRWEGDEDVVVTIYDGNETITHKGMYFTEYLDKKDKYSSFLGNSVYGRVDVTLGEGRPKLLIVKDSFAHSIVPFFAEHFDVTMIDPRYFKRSVIEIVEEEGFENVLVMCNMDSLSSARSFVMLKTGLK